MKKNQRYCQRQIQLSMLRAQWWLASVTSGHYKQQKISHTISSNNPALDTEFIDEEKLARAMSTAMRHIELAAEFSESLAEEEGASIEQLRISPPSKIALDGDGYASVMVDVKDDCCTKDPGAMFSLGDEVVVVDATQFKAVVGRS